MSKNNRTKINWTHSQGQAIKQRGTDLLVSASAGAGKTSVMIERIASMIENKEAKISELLVLTFTNASSMDMKAKLQKRLGMHLDSAFIGTFHKFCGELVRTYFNIAGVSPDFEILDETSSGIIKGGILDSVITKNYDKYSRVIDTFCVNRKTDLLYKLLISIHDFLMTRENAEDWLENYALASYDKDIAMKSILDYYKSTGDYYYKKFTDFGLTKEINPNVRECINLADNIRKVSDYGSLHKIALTAEFTRLKSKTDEAFKSVRDKFKEVVNKIKDNYSVPYLEMQKNQQYDRSLVVSVIELVKEFDSGYSQAKINQNKLDFNDLEKYACKVLEDLFTADTVRQKYKYIFIDEYQDTNPMQERILSQVSSERNIFMVGDVKQSIYGFRGCEAAIFAGKMTDFENNLRGKVVKLNENFRSAPNILKFVNGVFGRIMKDTVADIDYNKTSKFSVQDGTRITPPDLNSLYPSGGSTEIFLVNTAGGTAPKVQAALIAEKISHLIKQGANPSDIAILSRSRNRFNELIQVLQSAGIPARVNSETRASELFEIALLNNMLFAVSNFYNDVPIVLLMSSFVFGFTPGELAEIKLSGANSNKKDCFYNLLRNVKTEKVSNFLLFLDKYRDLAKKRSTADVLTVFLTEYKITDLLLLLPEGRVMTENIQAYLSVLRGAPYAVTVSGFLYLLENELLDIKIKPPAAGGGCVQVMTMHASKGLEFPIVFIFDAGASFNTSDTRQLMVIDKFAGLCVFSLDADKFKKTHSIARLGAVLSAKRVMIAEEMRLLYVALTRAKNRLIIIGGGKIENISANSEDYDILSSKSYLQFLAPAVLASVRDDCFSVQIKDAEEIKITGGEREIKMLTGKYDEKLVRDLKDIYIKPYPYKTDTVTKSSVSALTHAVYDEAETQYITPFKGAEDVNTPRPGGKEYGTAYHKKMQALEPAELEKIMPILKGAKIYKELPFLRGGETLVQGVIDLLALKDGKAIIIDYKTTKADEQKLVKLYKPQIEMYAAAVRSALPNIKESQAYIYSTVHEKLIKVD